MARVFWSAPRGFDTAAAVSWSPATSVAVTAAAARAARLSAALSLVDLDVPDALEADAGHGIVRVKSQRQPSPFLGKSPVSNQFTPRKRG